MVIEFEIPEGYQQTEMGIIPKDWVIKPFGDFVTIYVGGDLQEEKFSEYKDDYYKYPVFSNTVSNSGLYGYYNFSEYYGDSITVVGRGVGLGTAFKRSGGYGAIGRLLILFLDKSIDSKFVTEYINHKIKFFFESGGIPQLTGISFIKYRIPLPPTMEEQTAIATALSDMDALTENLDKLINKKRNIKQGAMQNLLRSVFSLEENKFNKFDFDMVFVKRNSKNYQIQTKEYQNSGKYPVIDQGKQKSVAFSDRDDKKFLCPGKGVIIFGDHTREIKYVDFDFIVGADGTQILETKAAFNTEFLYYCLNIKEIPNTGYNRHFKYLKEFEFFLPEIDEQNRIASILNDMDKEIQLLEQKLNKYRMIKQGMMQVLLTGKIRLI